MSLCRECCVLSGRGLCDELITRPEESCWLWCVVICNLETSWRRRPCPTGGCCAEKKNSAISICSVKHPSVRNLIEAGDQLQAAIGFTLGTRTSRDIFCFSYTFSCRHTANHPIAKPLRTSSVLRQMTHTVQKASPLVYEQFHCLWAGKKERAF